MARTDRGAILDRVDDLAGTVRLHAAESERLGRLVPAVVDALHDADLFRILVPVHLGGIGLTLPDSIEVVERVARSDAATAWTLAILSDGPLFARRYPDDVFAEVCSDPRALIAGTLNPAPARAEQVDGGYVFTGTATYLSGAAHARWLMAAAVVTRNGKPVFDAGGIDIRARLFPLDQATSLDNWNVTGMRATGSSDYVFEGITVEEAWTFAPLRPPATPPADVFAAIPLWSQLGGCRSATSPGSAIAGLRRSPWAKRTGSGRPPVRARRERAIDLGAW